MREYQIQIGLDVEAHNLEEAFQIAKFLRAFVEGNPQYKVRNVETAKVEEL